MRYYTARRMCMPVGIKSYLQTKNIFRGDYNILRPLRFLFLETVRKSVTSKTEAISDIHPGRYRKHYLVKLQFLQLNSRSDLNCMNFVHPKDSQERRIINSLTKHLSKILYYDCPMRQSCRDRLDKRKLVCNASDDGLDILSEEMYNIRIYVNIPINLKTLQVLF